jgi:hypothetical protein
MQSDGEVFVVMVVFSKIDFKRAPFCEQLSRVLSDEIKNIGNCKYEGDIYLGDSVPKYKRRGRSYVLPKNLSKFASEVSNGELWNFSVYGDDGYGGVTLGGVMQADSVLKQPASLFVTFPLSMGDAIVSHYADFISGIFHILGEDGWGFCDVTNNVCDYLFKINGITYGHFSESWKSDIDVWKRNRAEIGSGILDVYPINYLSPRHMSEVGDAVGASLEKIGVVLRRFPNGGASIDLCCLKGKDNACEAKKERVREVLKGIVWK